MGAAVIAGPSFVACTRSQEGLGACLYGELASRGILPVAEVDPAPAEPAPLETAVTEDIVDPASEAVGEPVPERQDRVAAAFELVRAEPDGSVLIAGVGEPGAEIEIRSDGELLGTARVEDSGDWLLVPETRLATGETEITLVEDGVVAPEAYYITVDGDSQPSVLRAAPGAAPSADETIAVAEADPAPAPEPEPAETDAAPADIAPAALDEPDLDDAEPTVPLAESEAASVASEADGETPVPAEAETQAEPVEPTVPDVSQTPEPEAPVEEPAAADPAPEQPAEPLAPVERDVPPAVEPEPEVQAEPQPEPEIVIASVPPSIDAVEIDGRDTFFAGDGPEGSTMRLYVDGALIGESEVDGGRWLVEGGDVLDADAHRIRIEAVDADGQTLAAEVNFVVERDAVVTAEAGPVAEAPDAPVSEPVVAPPVPETTPEVQSSPETDAVEPPSAPATSEAVEPEPATPDFEPALLAPQDDAGIAPLDLSEPVADEPASTLEPATPGTTPPLPTPLDIEVPETLPAPVEDEMPADGADTPGAPLEDETRADGAAASALVPDAPVAPLVQDVPAEPEATLEPATPGTTPPLPTPLDIEVPETLPAPDATPLDAPVSTLEAQDPEPVETPVGPATPGATPALPTPLDLEVPETLPALEAAEPDEAVTTPEPLEPPAPAPVETPVEPATPGTTPPLPTPLDFELPEPILEDTPSVSVLPEGEAASSDTLAVGEPSSSETVTELPAHAPLAESDSPATTRIELDPDLPTLVARPVGDDPEADRFASGQAIIRRGDNLWTIARRVYGAGIRYTAIFEANSDEIRDPDLIFPGQIFDLPETGQ